MGCQDVDLAIDFAEHLSLMSPVPSADAFVTPRITELTLENFKAFGRRQRIPVAPLTLVFGPNGAGKSSIIHGLGLLSHMAAGGSPNDQIARVGVEELRLGGMERLTHADSDRFSLGIEVRNRGDAEGRVVIPQEWERIQLELSFRLEREYAAVGLDEPESFSPFPEPVSVEVGIGGAPVMTLKVEPTDDVAYSYSLSELNEVHQVWARLPPGARGRVREAVAAVLDAAEGPNPSDRGWWPGLGGLRDVDSAAPAATNHVKELLSTVSRAVKTSLQEVSLLGGIRPIPSQDATAHELRDSVWAPLFWRDMLLRDVNAWLANEAHGMPYKLALGLRVDADQIKHALESPPQELPPTMSQLVSRILEDDTHLPMLDAERDFRRLIVQMRAQRYLKLIDRRTEAAVAFEHVGSGVSQFLPVLVAALAQSKRLIAIQQPELHLHPRLQTSIGDVFLESALGDRRNTVILETHSEHLILRILRRIRETAEGTLPEGAVPVRPEDVSVLYVRPGHEARELTGGGAHVERIPITPDGMFAGPWPGGFFDERLEELL